MSRLFVSNSPDASFNPQADLRRLQLFSQPHHSLGTPPIASRHLHPPLVNPPSSSEPPAVDLPLGSLSSSSHHLTTKEGSLQPHERTPRRLLGTRETLVVVGAVEASSRGRSLHRLSRNHHRQTPSTPLRSLTSPSRGHSSLPGFSSFGLATRGVRARSEIGYGKEVGSGSEGGREEVGRESTIPSSLEGNLSLT